MGEFFEVLDQVGGVVWSGIKIIIAVSFFAWLLLLCIDLALVYSSKESDRVKRDVKGAAHLFYFQVFITSILILFIPEQSSMTYAVFFIFQSFMIFISWQMSREKNWARWLLLWVFEIKILNSAGNFFLISKMSFPIILTYVLDFGLSYFAIKMIFTSPGNGAFLRNSPAKWRYIIVGIFLNIFFLFGIWYGETEEMGLGISYKQPSFTEESVKSTLKTYKNGGLSLVQRTSKKCYSTLNEHSNIEAVKKCVLMDIVGGILDGYAVQKYRVPRNKYFADEAFSYRAGPFFVKSGVSREETNSILHSWYLEVQKEMPSHKEEE